MTPEEDIVAGGLFVIDVGHVAVGFIVCITVLVLVGNEAERRDENYDVEQTQVW